MTLLEQYRELIDIIHDGSYHEEETAQDILDARYRKIPCGAVVFTADERFRWETSMIEDIEMSIAEEIEKDTARTIVGMIANQIDEQILVYHDEDNERVLRDLKHLIAKEYDVE